MTDLLSRVRDRLQWATSNRRDVASIDVKDIEALLVIAEQPALSFTAYSPLTHAEIWSRRCSFCGVSIDQARRMVGGAIARICDECVELSARLIGDEDRRTGMLPPPAIEARPKWTAANREIL